MKSIPPVRPLEAMQIEEAGEPMVVLRDPAGYSPESVTLSLDTFSIVTLLTHEQTLQQLQEATMKNFGFRPEEEELAAFITRLDDAFMLQSKKFASHREEEKQNFLEQPLRSPHFAGQSYPADPIELSARMFELFIEADSRPDKNVTAIAVPHIDFSVGADLMAEGWKTLQGTDADIIVILGTGHMLSDDFFACLDKPYKTPIGTMPVDSTLLAALGKNFGEDIFAQAEAHRHEHSLEFAALFFAHLFKKRPEVTALPLLLSFPEAIHDLDHAVFNGERLEKFIAALRKTIAESGKKVAFVASVDFAHIGQRFGDDALVSSEQQDRIKRDDESLIEALIKGDNERFLREIKEVNHHNRVCGFPPLYVMQKLSNTASGTLLGYRQNVEGDNEAMVSFATLALR